MKTNYKKIELEIKDLVTQGREKLYDIATRCVTLLNDSDSYAISLHQKTEDVIARLQGYLADFNIELDECVLILKVFPDKDQWTACKNVRELFDKAAAQIRSEAKQEASEAEPTVVPSRKRVKVSEFEQVVKERNDAIYEAKTARDREARLLAENDQLKARVATLEGQVEELRRLTATVAGR